MKRLAKVFPIILMIMGLIIIPVKAKALDFGDFSGDSDYGSDDSWDSGGWDSGGSDWDSDSGSYRSNSDAVELDTADLHVLFIVLGIGWGTVIMIYVINNAMDKKRRQRSLENSANRELTNGYKLRSVTEYTTAHPEFSEVEFKKKLADLYVRCQHEWQRKDISSLRPYFTAPFFSQMDTQLSSYRMKRQTNYIDDIYVISVDLMGYYSENGFDVMVARLKTRIIDYVKDDYTDRIIRGSDTKQKIMTYGWTLVKKSDSVQRGAADHICPHCGARISMNQSAVCEYCGSTLTTDSFDWVISNIRGISQKTL